MKLGIILKWILNLLRGHERDLSGSVYGKVAGFYECGDEPSGSVKCGEYE
jgi:hypothetical protein